MKNNAIKYTIICLTAVAFLAVLNYLAAALVPFITAAILSYIFSPLANRLEEQGMSSLLSASVLTFFILLLALILPIVLTPLVVAQFQEMMLLLPKVLGVLEGWLGAILVGDISDQVKENLPSLISPALSQTDTLATLLSSGLSVVGGFITLLLITPLATFYLLRDRKRISGELTDLLPPAWRKGTARLFYDFNNVIGEFLHGQLMVMVIMSFIYFILLKIAGLEFALTIGFISGILTFIPYVGFIIGLSLAILVSLSNFESWIDLFIVIGLMGVGTTLESLFITPRIVGERVGLHPVFILLALSVFGHTLGFIGVLAAVPLSAILLVSIRHLRRYYINSNFYKSD